MTAATCWKQNCRPGWYQWSSHLLKQLAWSDRCSHTKKQEYLAEIFIGKFGKFPVSEGFFSTLHHSGELGSCEPCNYWVFAHSKEALLRPPKLVQNILVNFVVQVIVTTACKLWCVHWAQYVHNSRLLILGILKMWNKVTVPVKNWKSSLQRSTTLKS
jgi:hypothetical protein